MSRTPEQILNEAIDQLFALGLDTLSDELELVKTTLVDAERYRWLRTARHIVDDDTPYANIGYGDEGVFGEKLDEMIDKLMEEK